MKLVVAIEPYKFGRSGSLYTVHINGNPKNFMEQYDANPLFKADGGFSTIAQSLEYMTDLVSYREQFFKHESKRSNSISALNNDGSLRLYCIWSHKILILGGACIKKQKTYQQECSCNNAVIFLEKLDAAYRKSIDAGTTDHNLKDRRIHGKKSFEIEL